MIDGRCAPDARVEFQRPGMGAGRAVVGCVLGVAAMALGACAMSKDGPGSTPRSAVGVQWEQRGTPSAGGPRTLLLGPDGRASGFAGVNRYFGRYTLDADGAFMMTGIGATRMAGPPEEMRGEDEFLDALRNTTNVRMDSGDLVLRGLRVLRFRRAPAE